MTNTAAAVRFVGRDIYYGWVVLGVAALAMVGTLPGRTQGLGLITEPLLSDLGVSRVQFAQINFVATLIGSLFVGIGALVDRRGSRMVLTALALLLGAVVVAMSRVHGVAMLLVLITLTRGLGQSALSVVSLAMPGKWFRRRLTWAMAVYAVVMSIGFMIAFPIVGSLVLTWGWRATWAAIGAALILGLAPVAWALVRPEPATNRELEADDAAPSDGLADRLDARRDAAITGLLGVRPGERDVWPRRVGDRPVQRVDSGHARLCARRLSPGAGGHRHHRARRQLRRRRVGRSRFAAPGARRRPACC